MEYNSDYDIRLATLGEMGGDTGKTYNSVYDIDLDILRLTEQGGGGGGGAAITDVSILPDAAENKNKFYRLISDNKVYVADKSVETSIVNLSDAEQVDNAYLVLYDENYVYYYQGDTQYTLTDDFEHEFNVYMWKGDYDGYDILLFTDKKASEMTGTNAICYKDTTMGDEWEKIGNTSYYLSGDEIQQLTVHVNQPLMTNWDNDLNAYVLTQNITTESWNWQTIQPMKSVTYSELKSLRDNKQLVVGQQYRITDYVTTTAQSGTTSAGNPFDIIVTADDVDKLNENARALHHKLSAFIYYVQGDGGSTGLYQRYPDEDDEHGYAWCFNNSDTDYNTKFSDGIIPYINWSDVDTSDIVYTDALTPSIGSLVMMGDTKVVITDFSENAGHFMNSKLEAWEIKYCLDNDTNRFSWAQTEKIDKIQIYPDDQTETYLYVRYSEGDNDGKYAWAFVNGSGDVNIDDTDVDWNDIDTASLIYTNSEIPNIDDVVYEWDGEKYEVWNYIVSERNVIPAGKGVIYYMQDEWNNRCYFDFKNIKFDFVGEGSYNFVFENAESYDATLGGGSKNNVVEGKYDDENNILTLDTTLNFSEYINNYRGELVTINDNTTTLQEWLEALAPLIPEPPQPNNEIWYTTNDGQPLDLDNVYRSFYPLYFEYDEQYGWNSHGTGIVSNTYQNGKGVIVLGHELNGLDYNSFYNEDGEGNYLTSISLPSSVTALIPPEEYMYVIGENAFLGQDELTEFKYGGTKDEFMAIYTNDQLGMEWCLGCNSLTTITCSDGDLLIDTSTGTITDPDA